MANESDHPISSIDSNRNTELIAAMLDRGPNDPQRLQNLLIAQGALLAMSAKRGWSEESLLEQINTEIRSIVLNKRNK